MSDFSNRNPKRSKLNSRSHVRTEVRVRVILAARHAQRAGGEGVGDVLMHPGRRGVDLDVCEGARAAAGKRERVSHSVRWHRWWAAAAGVVRLKVEGAVAMST